jgi:oligoribonuclease NrnB/cAMP/cGMP phosphodiesterase (DHH superfamily)
MKSYDIIIYHQGCSDGITALWCADKYFKENNIEYEKLSCPAGKDPTINFENKRIIFVDLCPSLDFITDISTIAKQITIVDHHKSAFDMFLANETFLKTLENVEIILKMEYSGCQLTWDYFYPDIARPWFVDYVGDRDLWKWELPNSREINSAFYHCEYINDRKLELLDELNNEDIDKLINIGKTVIEVQNKIINTQLKQSIECIFNVGETKYNVRVGCINRDLRSDLGNAMCTVPLKNGDLPDFSIVWNYDPIPNAWYMSMRGTKNSPDLSVISKHFGGGGHAKASGFENKKNPFGNLFIIN